MKVKNPWGYTHQNIDRIWMEENVRKSGRGKAMHRIMGTEAGRESHRFVLDWGSDREEVRAEYEGMMQHMRAGEQEIWDCGLHKVKKEM